MANVNINASGPDVKVEFFGIARQRTGTSSVRVAVDSHISLGQLWKRLSSQFPDLPQPNLEASHQLGLRVNLDGERFISDPGTIIRAGQNVLFMSADAGG